MSKSQDNFILALQLRKLVAEQSLSVKRLSEASDVPLKTIYGWLGGSHPRNIVDLKKVSRVLGVSVDELSFDDGKESAADFPETESSSQDIPAIKNDDVREVVRLFIENTLKMILTHPESVSVTTIVHERTTIYEVDLLREDFGRFLGSQGKHIEALRTLCAAMAAHRGIRCVVNVKDEHRFF